MPTCPNHNCYVRICDDFCVDICNRLSSSTTIFCPYCGIKLLLQKEPNKCNTCHQSLPNTYHFTLTAYAKED